MRKALSSRIVVVGLALFAMIFGGGNLIFPLYVGLTSGNHFWWAVSGFLLTAVLLPFIGLLSIILFDGNYCAFFQRIGSRMGLLLLFVCVMVIGPLIGIPRIVTLSHNMLQPWLSSTSILMFSAVYLLLNVIGAWHKALLVSLFAYIVTPLILLCLGIIVGHGLLLPGAISVANASWATVFMREVMYGFSTLDVLAVIFFGALMLTLLKRMMLHETRAHVMRFAFIAFYGGLLAFVVLAMVYIGLAYVGHMHGGGVNFAHAGDLFREVAGRLLGRSGCVVISLTVFAVCYTTSVALLMVTAQYFQETLFDNRIGYRVSLVIAGVLSFVPCYLDLSRIFALTSGPVANILYPTVIMLMLCNVAYKIYGVRAVKVPVLLTFLISSALYSYQLIAQ